MDKREDKVTLAIFLMGTVPLIDLAAVESLTELRENLGKRGIELRLAEAHSTVREILRRSGFEEHYGPIEPDQTIATILQKPSHHSPTTT